MDINLVVFGGRLVRDPELRFTPAGTPVCNMTLAASETRTGKIAGEKIKTTCFMDVVVWGKTGESTAKYLSKGFLCVVEGKLNLNRWETPEGHKRSKVEIYASKVIFGDNRGKEQHGGGQTDGFGGDEFEP